MLIVLSGLPGVGKSTVARALASRMRAVHLRIDSIEQAIRASSGVEDVGPTGYCVAYALARDNLAVGLSVVADSVNPWALTRAAWREVAQACSCAMLDVELVCSNADVHRGRVEGRHADVPGLVLPTWEEVLRRDYEPWTTPRLVIDTAVLGPSAAATQILEAAVARGLPALHSA